MNKTTKAKKQRKAAKREFTGKTRVYDLLKREAHEQLKLLADDIRPYVKDADGTDWKHLRRFDVDYSKIKKTEFLMLIAGFLHRIGKGDGLKCKMSVFLRYLSENEHSNFGLKYRSLNTHIYRMLDYIEALENV